MELGSQVDSTTADHFQLLLFQLGEDQNSKRAEPAEVITTKAASTTIVKHYLPMHWSTAVSLQAYLEIVEADLRNQRRTKISFLVPPYSAISSHLKKKGMQPMTSLSTG